eukprot:COSAG06_NODE_49665_length_323_cov_57.696429_1_plen_75_part_10
MRCRSGAWGRSSSFVGGTLVRWYVALGRRPDADVQVVELPQHERKALIERHKRVKVRPSLSDLYDTHLYMCLLPA